VGVSTIRPRSANADYRQARQRGAVLSIDARRGIALSSGCNATQVAKDQFQGATATVFEKCNEFGGERGEAYRICQLPQLRQPRKCGRLFQLEQAVGGLSHAARILGIPIVGGNVSLYNESEEFHTAIIPTPSIGMVGIVDDISTVPPAVFQEKEISQ